VRSVSSYYCIINMPAAPCREIAVLPASRDEAARHAAAELSASWPGFETVQVYDGERLVQVLVNSSLGPAAEPLAA
jgi:hypothetical protein